MDTNLNELRDVNGEEQRDVAGGAATTCPRFSWGSCFSGFGDGVTGDSAGPTLIHETTHAK